MFWKYGEFLEKLFNKCTVSNKLDKNYNKIW